MKIRTKTEQNSHLTVPMLPSTLLAILSAVSVRQHSERRAHLPHEANVEQVFSLSGRLSDPNMDPEYLGILTSVGRGKKIYKPPVSEIFQLYLTRFGKANEDDLGE